LTKLYSCNFHDDSNIEKLTIESLTQYASYATKITIASAYYSVDFFYELFQSIPIKSRKKCKICLILNGFCGVRLKRQQDELEEMKSSLLELGYKTINIYLNTNSSLFHTKLYKFDLPNETKWFIGSANSTLSAFRNNEEILLHLTGKHEYLEKYVEYAIKNSYPYDEIEITDINNMIKFWRTGLIYYKPIANIQFTFSILKIPSWVNNELSQLDNMPPFASPGEPLGPFNLKLALDIEENDKPSAQVRHNQWSIETCFGYWVPSKYKDELDSKINEASQSKREKLNEINLKIHKLGRRYIVEQFRKYIEGVEANLTTVYKNFKWTPGDRIVVKYENEYFCGTVKKCGTKKIQILFDDGDTDEIKKADPAIAGVGKKRKVKKGINKLQLKSYLSKEFWHTPENSVDLFEAFLNRIIKRLNDDRYKKRSCAPLVSSTMPEIWSDPLAVEEFSETFFEYITFKLNMDSKPLVIRSLINKCGIQSESNVEEVKEQIESYIERYGWSEDDWL
jgi:hypothetical protein